LCQNQGVMITNESVEVACNEVSEYSEEKMAIEFERFFKTQPDLCEFIAELTTDSDQKIQELSLFLSYMIYKVVEVDRPEEIPAVSHESIEAAFRESEAWIERMNEAENDQDVPASLLSGLEDDTEPNLLQYVISEINEPMEDGTQLADEEKGEVFFVLKTVIASLIGGTI
jgi:hypothetical protein